MEQRKVNDFSEFYNRSEDDFPRALEEIKAGAKQGHWIWYVFPQLQILGYSPIAKYFGLKSVAEATAYLLDPVLGPRLVEISQVALDQLTTGKKNINYLMGSSTDALKLRSSATLFFYASRSTGDAGKKSLFHELRTMCEALLKGRDEQTIEACEKELVKHSSDAAASSSAADVTVVTPSLAIFSNAKGLPGVGLDFSSPILSSMATRASKKAQAQAAAAEALSASNNRDEASDNS